MTYRLGGTQYVAVAAGFGGSTSWQMADGAAARTYENKGRMIVFKLDGGPVTTPPKRPVPKGPPLVDTTGFPPPDPVLMKRGAQLYGRCGACHGRSGSAPSLPNLERVHDIGPDGFRAIVQGALEPLGMPSFAGRLSDDDIKALYEYISRGEHNKPTDVHWY
jgi:quinohemoprotein ethanol dehydrogenase